MVMLWIGGLVMSLLAVMVYVIQSKHVKNPNWEKMMSSSSASRNILLVIAHPDDECMFFGPTLLNLHRLGKVHVLCLSTGNLAGLGSIRKEELFSSCQTLGIPQERVFILDHKNLQDGPMERWSEEVVAEQVKNVVLKTSPNVIVTFDSKGVSGHSNHIETFQGTKHLLQSSRELSSRIKLFSLVSHSTIRKYLGILSLGFLLTDERYAFVATTQQTKTSRDAMTRHQSQFVWFRQLYVFFSSYMFVNVLEEVEIR